MGKACRVESVDCGTAGRFEARHRSITGACGLLVEWRDYPEPTALIACRSIGDFLAAGMGALEPQGGERRIIEKLRPRDIIASYGDIVEHGVCSILYVDEIIGQQPTMMCVHACCKAGATRLSAKRYETHLQAGHLPMDALLAQYLPIVVFLGVALAISSALLIAPFLIAIRNPEPEKVSAYECGFNAFDDARMKFDVRFYLVSILFIIFDLEVAFLFPWAVAFKNLGDFGFWSMMVFLGLLTIGFIYEWKKGALEWD